MELVEDVNLSDSYRVLLIFGAKLQLGKIGLNDNTAVARLNTHMELKAQEVKLILVFA